MIIGVDPGLTGYITILWDDGSHIISHPIPIYKVKTKKHLDTGALYNILARYGAGYAVIEKQFVVPGQGLGSSAKTMMNFGIILGMLIGLGIKTYIVDAKEWQKETFGSTEDTKAASVLFAQQIYPHISLKTSKRINAANNHNLADSLCIAHYGRGL